MDDTFTICKSDTVNQFTNHINQIDDDIKFTRELEKDSSIAFLDTLVTRNEDNTISLKVYRKPTHTDQYLDFHSHHPLHQKLGIVSTLCDRCETIVTKEPEKDEEKKRVASALACCGYPKWSQE